LKSPPAPLLPTQPQMSAVMLKGALAHQQPRHCRPSRSRQATLRCGRFSPASALGEGQGNAPKKEQNLGSGWARSGLRWPRGSRPPHRAHITHRPAQPGSSTQPQAEKRLPTEGSQRITHAAAPSIPPPPENGPGLQGP